VKAGIKRRTGGTSQKKEANLERKNRSHKKKASKGEVEDQKRKQNLGKKETRGRRHWVQIRPGVQDKEGVNSLRKEMNF